MFQKLRGGETVGQFELFLEIGNRPDSYLRRMGNHTNHFEKAAHMERG